MVETVRGEVEKGWMKRVRGRDREWWRGEKRGWKGVDGGGERR
jgi:hypothetical protein